MNDPIETDWPADPDNEDLIRLAEQLRDVAAPLPPESLTRIEQQLGGELERAARRSRWRRIALGWSIAAAILLAIGGYALFRVGRGEMPPLAIAAPAVVDDHITIAVGNMGQAPAADQPLVRLDDYRSLFTD